MTLFVKETRLAWDPLPESNTRAARRPPEGDMRRRILGLCLPWLVLMGCSGQNVVAGDEKTKAEQLESSLPSWCQSTCVKLRACEADQDCGCSGDVCECSAGVDEDCDGACQDELTRWAQGGEECAAIGLRFQQCIDEAGCSLLDTTDRCSISEAEQATCPSLDGSDSEPPSAGNGSGPSGGPNGGTSGPSLGPTPQPLVTCQEGYGTGGGTGQAQPEVICEEGHLACSDGHDHVVVCVRTSEGQTFCSCLLDEAVTGGFDPAGVCPTTEQLNLGCGWNLEVEEI